VDEVAVASVADAAACEGCSTFEETAVALVATSPSSSVSGAGASAVTRGSATRSWMPPTAARICPCAVLRDAAATGLATTSSC